jgi:hypothetical protein
VVSVAVKVYRGVKEDHLSAPGRENKSVAALLSAKAMVNPHVYLSPHRARAFFENVEFLFGRNAELGNCYPEAMEKALLFERYENGKER